MSTSLDHDCNCSCHDTPPGEMHAVPCCDGPCDICSRRIREDGMQKHLDEQHPSAKSNYGSADGSAAVARYDAARAELVLPEPPKREAD